ncbi:MAG: nucleotidyl transferase AbiEii/AbiGii toxin family protein [Actinobacteria bacterium]|nr:nucleotidyl transferase AbiEii/AbiGii toxin family protein [Actinomycetota bacterium]
MRFFFNSLRYSEDMDIDVSGLSIAVFQNMVLEILLAQSFSSIFKPYGIDSIIAPDIIKAKQTETTQRFKVHLITFSGEELFTKIEFSRRGLKEGIVIQSVSDNILRSYKLIPLLIPHYNIKSTIIQKIGAIASRSVVQARDIYDLYILNSQFTDTEITEFEVIEKDKLEKAYNNVFEVTFEQFQDSVVSYLPPEEQIIYGKDSSWDEIRLKAVNLIGEFRREHE